MAKPRALLATFDRLHRAHLGAPAFFRRGKDAALIADLARSQGKAGTVALMESYFRSADPFIRANGYGVGVFVSVASKLIAQQARDVQANRARHWRDECARVHDGRCSNFYIHDARVARDAEEES